MITKEWQRWLKMTAREENDLYCRECGNLLIEKFQIEDFYVRFNRRKKQYTNPAYTKKFKSMYVIEPKNFDGKKLFRHTCWECYDKFGGNSKKVHIGVIKPDFHLLFDITEEDLKMITSKKYNTASKHTFIRRHGKIEGEQKYKEYCKRQGYTASTEYFVKEKGMTPQQARQHHQSRACTKTNFIKRYGEVEGSAKWKAYRKWQSYAGCTLSYFVEKYGKKEGKERYINLQHGRAKGGMLSQSKWSINSYSAIASELFDYLNYDNAKYGDNECLLIAKCDCSMIFPDFLVEKTKKIIEFYGSYWHADPKQYKSEDILNFPHSQKKKAQDIWDHDTKRIQKLKDLGYDILIVWESDYIDNKEETIKRCQEFLDNV